MKVVPFDPVNWKKDHPTGNYAFQHMLKGDPTSADNFMYVVARQDADFEMPRHRHNFDQIRLPLRGDMNLGRGFMLRQGQVGYFAEGLAYGPQSDLLGAFKPGEPMQLVLQFGGASNYGFMSIEQRREAWAELQKTGKFVGPHYHHADGRVEWGLNTVWEKVFGVKLKYPRSRYKDIVIADPQYFSWRHVDGAPGAEHKYLGAFSERGVWIEMLKFRSGAKWSSGDPKARRLFFVLSGQGAANAQAFDRYSAIQVEPGETLGLSAASDVEMFLIGLPPIPALVTESEQYDLEELPPEELAEKVG